MKRAFTTLIAAATLMAAVFVSATDADARHRRGHVGAAVAAGVIGGALVAGALASRPAYAYPAYRPAPGYVVYQGYYAGPPVGCPGGYWARRPIRNQWGQVVGWTRPRFFCPY